MLGNLIGSMIVAIIGYSLIGPLNTYGYYLGYISFGVAILISTLTVVTTMKYIFYSNESDSQSQEVKKKKHKQTYFEYVKERMAVEKVMK